MCDTCKPDLTISRRTFIKGALAVGAGAALTGVEPLLGSTAEAAVTEPAILTCAEWYARPPKQPIVVLPYRPNKIIIHHTAGANSTDYSMLHARRLAQAVQQAHFARGFIDSGQHFMISRGGYILQGRHNSVGALRKGDRHVLGAHCEGQNRYALGIENEGTYTSALPTRALYTHLVSLCAYMCKQYRISPGRIYGHRDFGATQCPGDRLYSMLPRLRRDVAYQLSSGKPHLTAVDIDVSDLPE